jgi:hypothetical protein
VGGVAISTASGTVTSVDVSGGTTGLTTSGGPVTSSGTITIAGTLAVANGGTGITSLGTGVATFLGTPSSANLAAAVTDETGSRWLPSPLGLLAPQRHFNALGYPSGGQGWANVATFLGTPSSANLAAAVTDETGSGSLVFATSPTFVTPVLGTPTSGTLSGCTVDGTNSVGFKNIPQSGSAKTTSYILATGDVGKFIEVGASGSIDDS